MPGTPSGKSFVYDIETGGRGGYSGRTNPYSYALEQEALGAQREREEREQESFEMAKRKEERELARQDLVDKAQEYIDTQLGDPASMKHQNAYEKVMGNPLVHRARATLGGRQVIDGLLKQYHDAHQEYLNTWKQIASNYGYTGDISTLPQNPDGTVHWDRALKEVFDPALKARQAAIQKKLMQESAAAEKAGYAELEMTDPMTGKTKIELKKKVDSDPFLSPERKQRLESIANKGSNTNSESVDTE